MVPIDLNIDLLDDLLEDLVIEILKEVNELCKRNAVVLLEEPNDIGLSTALYEVVELSTLRIKYFHRTLRLYLAHQVHIRKLSNID